MEWLNEEEFRRFGHIDWEKGVRFNEWLTRLGPDAQVICFNDRPTGDNFWDLVANMNTMNVKWAPWISVRTFGPTSDGVQYGCFFIMSNKQDATMLRMLMP